MPGRYFIRRLSLITLWVLGVCVFLPMIFWAGWFNVWKDTLQCEHVSEGVRCTVTSSGPAGDQRPVLANGALRAEIENYISHTGGRRRSTSRRVLLTTPAGPVVLSLPILSTLTPPRQRELVAELDTFVQNPAAPPFTKTLGPGLPVRLMISALGLLGLVGWYALGQNTVLEVDESRNLVIRRRVWRIVRETLQVPLDKVMGVELGARIRQHVALLLHRQGGEPIELGPITWGQRDTALAGVRAFIDAQQKGGS